MNLKQFEEDIALGVGEATVIAAEHKYGCRCDACLEWWAHVGPDGGEPGDYGPFTKEEVNAKQRDLGMEETE